MRTRGDDAIWDGNDEERPVCVNRVQHVPENAELKADVHYRLQAMESVTFFSKLINFIFGYFDPTNIFFDNEKKYFLG